MFLWSMGWVDRGSLWSLDTSTESETRIPFSEAKYLSLHPGNNEETPFWGGQPANNYFKWFHVFEDEINHRGQIRWLCKRLPG